MKTTLELPELVIEPVRKLAIKNGRSIEEELTDQLIKRYSSVAASNDTSEGIRGYIELPLVRRPLDFPARKLTIEEALALEEEALYGEQS